MSRVFVAMSGGVDSSVAAALLVRAGHDVVGVTMQLLPSSDVEGGCCSVSASRDAHRVCDVLGVPHYTLNVRDEFAAEVVDDFCRSYAAGRTPNPCIVCNDRVKFVELWRRVALQGAEYLATGHYARVLHTHDSPRLARGVDPAKDQSYFLYRMTAEQLGRTLFPVGELTKPEVRRIAEDLRLPTAKTPESQDVCFVPEDAASFVTSRQEGASTPGPIVDTSGRRLGTHRGLAAYTVGQRRGLAVGGAGRMYVVDIHADANEIVVGTEEELAVDRVVCRDVVWHADVSADVLVQTRYRETPQPARAVVTGGDLTLTFETPHVRPARGQAAVCYQGDLVIGGGVVEEAG